MMTPPAAVTSRPAVRFPFRVLAALIFVAGLVATVGMAYMTWDRGAQMLGVKDVVMWPGEAWLMRLAFYAALRGTVAGPDSWPFVSPRVAGCYWLILICLSVATS